MPRLENKQPLSVDDRKILLIELQEAESRGIKLPKEALQILHPKKYEWSVAPNGYFIRDDGKLYDPSPTHEAFIKSTARYVGAYGPRGSGKTGSGSQKACLKIREGESGIVMNPDFENLKISTWVELKRWIPWDMVVPSQRHRHSDVWQPHQPFTMSFYNGAIMYIKGGKETGSTRGPNVNWFWYDEAGRDELGITWQITNAGVRIGKNPQSWATYTPRPKEHWSYRFFIEQKIPPDVLEELDKLGIRDTILIETYHLTREDNKKNLDPLFYMNLSLNYPSGWLRAQEYDGEYSNEGGKIGDRNWFNNKILDVAPEARRRVRFWDLAATEKKQAKDDPDETVGTLISKFMFDKEDVRNNGKDNFCMEHQISGYWAWEKLLEVIANTARHDGPDVKVVIEQEPGSGGKNQIAAVQTYFRTIPELSHHTIKGQLARDVGDRVMAANHWFGIAAEGRMWMLRGSWNEHFLSQLDGFTQIVHDDCVTSTTGAMTELSPFASWKSVPFMRI